VTAAATTLPLSPGSSTPPDMVRRTLKVATRLYRERAENTRFGNPWSHSEIRLGGLYLKELGIAVGDECTVTVTSPRHITLTRRRANAVDGRVVTVTERSNGYLHIKIGGRWLSEAGFAAGDDVEVIATEHEIRLIGIPGPKRKPATLKKKRRARR